MWRLKNVTEPQMGQQQKNQRRNKKITLRQMKMKTIPKLSKSQKLLRGYIKKEEKSQPTFNTSRD